MKLPIRATIVLSLTLGGLLGASASAATPSVKIIQGAAYGFDGVSAIGSNGTHVWVANSGNSSVTEINANTGAEENLLDGSKYDFDGPAHLSDDGTHVWVANETGNSVTEVNATTGALVRVIQGSSYKLHGTSLITSDGKDVWICEPAWHDARRSERHFRQLRKGRQGLLILP